MIRTKKEFEKFFCAEILPDVRAEFESDGRVDSIARRETWNNVVDSMAQDRQVPRHAINWDCPW